jgi:hypothetical protein
MHFEIYIVHDKKCERTIIPQTIASNSEKTPMCSHVPVLYRKPGLFTGEKSEEQVGSD